MKTNQFTKCIWRFSTLVTAVWFALTGVGIGATRIESDSTHQGLDEAPLPDSWEHFLYLRHDFVDGTAKTDSLVLLRATREGFDSRAVFSKRNLNMGWRPLGVCNGKLYAIKMGVLITVDFETGTAAAVDSRIDSGTWIDRKLYTSVLDRSTSHPSILRVYDAETESYRDIVRDLDLPRVGSYRWPPVLQVSPDHKWLAYFCRSTNFKLSYMHQLRLVAVDDGTIKASEVSVAAREFMDGDVGTVSSPPFCWLDSNTLLVVRDVSTNHFSMAWDVTEGGMPDMILARVDIEADRITDICRLPQFYPRVGEPFFRTAAQETEAPRLVIGRLGQYRIDLAERRLVQDAEIGGGYRYTRGKSDYEADGLRFKDQLLQSEMVIPEVAASPDGSRVAWHARPIIRPPSDAYASNIRFHDTVSGDIGTVAPEWIPGAWEVVRLSFEGNLIWISTRDLAPRSQANLPAGWQRFSPRPLGGGR